MGGEGTYPGQNPQNQGRTCPHCGGGDIFAGAYLTQTGQVRLSIGLAYKAAAIFTGAEMLQADICRACGTVLRFFVRDPSRNWLQR